MAKEKNKKHFLMLNILLFLHISIIFSVMFDLSKEPYYNFQIERFFTYDESTLISSLLVVWAFLTAIIIYYMERKDEKIYGVNYVTIIRNVLNKIQKKSLIIIFILDLFLMLFAAVISLPITLVNMAILLPILTFYILAISVKIFEKKTLISLIKESIKREYKKAEDGTQSIGQGVLYEIIHDSDITDEELLDNMLEIFHDLFLYLINNNCDFEDIIFILRDFIIRFQNDKLRNNFLKTLIEKEEMFYDEGGLEIINAVLILILEEEEQKPISIFEEMCGIIKNIDRRNVLIIRCMLYNFYQEAIEGKKNRHLYNKAIEKRIGGKCSKKAISVFFKKMNKKYPNTSIPREDMEQILIYLE